MASKVSLTKPVCECGDSNCVYIKNLSTAVKIVKTMMSRR